MIKEASIHGENFMFDFTGAPLWKVIAINLLFLTYGTFVNRKLPYLRNHIEVEGCCSK